jgi:sugar lactone lactonase YvrE
MRSRLVVYILAASLVIPVVVARPTRVAAVQAGPVRILGPRGEATPVVNERNELQLHVEGAASVTRWSSDSPDVATVGEHSGLLSGKKYGFATITAETSGGTAQVIAVVVRKTPKRASKAQGDTKTDTGGNVYLSSPLQHVIYKAGASGSGVLAGALGQPGYAGGEGTTARFHAPTGLGVDNRADGGVYVADTENHCVRRIRQGGQVEVVVGAPQHMGRMRSDRTAMSEALLDGPRGVVVVGGNLMVADTENHCIWYVDLARKEVRIVAGEPGASGLANGRGRAARFDHPSGLAVSPDGRLIAVADSGNNVVRLIAIGKESEQTVYDVTTLGQASSRRGVELSKVWAVDDLADIIRFTAPESVSIDTVGNVYVIDAVSAVVVTRREDAVEAVDLAQFGTLGDPASVTLSGTQAFVLDAAATTDEAAVNSVEVGPPRIARVSPEVAALEGGQEVDVEGANFAPESEVILGDGEVENLEVLSATRLRFRVPAQRVRGARTLSVQTRGGVAQMAFAIGPTPLAELSAGEITTLVGGGIAYIGDGGDAVADGVNVSHPGAVAVDAAGNLLIADADNNRIRQVSAATGAITTLAGTGEANFGGAGGPAAAARLKGPYGVTVDAAGNVLVADTGNNCIRRIDSATGIITTVAGMGDGPLVSYGGDGGPATAAHLWGPRGVAVDTAGNIFIGDTENNRIRRVSARTRVITTIAGKFQGYKGDGGRARAARLYRPGGVAFDAAGNLFIADIQNGAVRRIDARTKIITTVAGNHNQASDGDGGPATSAQLVYPSGVAVDVSGNLLVTEIGTHRVRRVDAVTQVITTVAGMGTFGFEGDGGLATAARLDSPQGIAVDAAGNLFIADWGNSRIRRVDAATRVITTVAGTGDANYTGDGGQALAATLAGPEGVAVDRDGNVFVADSGRNRIRRVDAATGRISTFAGTGEAGSDGDGGAATDAMITEPHGMATDAYGNLYVADAYARIRMISAATGIVTTVAGGGTDRGDGIPATAALLDGPRDVAFDGSGNMFIADWGSSRIRRVDASTGLITTVAGMIADQGGYGGDGGPATAARLNAPIGVAVDADGNVFIADTYNDRIRKVDHATGVITTVAGTGQVGGTGQIGDVGDGGPATSAELYQPQDVAVDADGNLLIADTANHRIRRVDMATGVITTVAGQYFFGYSGDGGPATEAQMDYVVSIALDPDGNLLIADVTNNVIRIVKSPLAGGARASAGDRRRVPASRENSTARDPNSIALARTWIVASVWVNERRHARGRGRALRLFLLLRG